MTEKPGQFLEAPTARIRFVERDGKRILQQLHEWTSLDQMTGGGEWRDVPLENEDE
jgi:hypothetical protein